MGIGARHDAQTREPQDAKKHFQDYLRMAPDGQYVADAKKLLVSL